MTGALGSNGAHAVLSLEPELLTSPRGDVIVSGSKPHFSAENLLKDESVFRLSWGGTLSLNQQLWFFQIWEGFLRLLVGYSSQADMPLRLRRHICHVGSCFWVVQWEEVGGDTFYLVIVDESGCLRLQNTGKQSNMQSCPSWEGWEILDDMS